MKKSVMLMCAGIAAATMMLTGCGKTAGNPKAVVKMKFKNELAEAEKICYGNAGYDTYKEKKEALDTLDIDRAEKDKSGDQAVVFYSYKKKGEEQYVAQPVEKSKTGDWYEIDKSKLNESNKYKEEMEKAISDWEKKSEQK